ncbi:MAG: hypothetical protein WBP00_09335 [Saprospiraceae bacterium]
MKNLTLFTFFGFLCLSGYFVRAQEETMPESTLDQFRFGSLNPNEQSTIYGVSNQVSVVVGDYYIDKSWKLGVIDFYPYKVTLEGREWNIDTVKNERIRFNTKSNELEINTKYGVKIISGDKIRSFITGSGKDAIRVINGQELGYKPDDKNFGFYQELFLGEVSLYSTFKVSERKPTYVPAFDVGDKNTEILKKEFFYLKDHTGFNKMKANYSGVLKAMSDKEDELSRYMDKYQLDPALRQDLVRIIRYYSGLLASGIK